jgi:hypothetical protein
MSDATSTPADRSSVFTGLPTGIGPYVAIVAALVSAAIHLWLAPVLLSFAPTQAILFVLAGLGWIGGILVFLTRYWRRSFYIVAIVFALAQLIAFVVLNGPLSPMAITAKAAEAVFVVTAVALYMQTQSGTTATPNEISQ